MPNYVRRSADDPPRPVDSEKDLRKALAAVDKEVAALQKERAAIRNGPGSKEERRGLLDARTAADQEVLDRQADLQKRLARLLAPGSGPGQTVAVGSATEGNR